ncbi:hypothetical protein NKG94_07110 [Micromonospora sp. M12]
MHLVEQAGLDDLRRDGAPLTPTSLSPAIDFARSMALSMPSVTKTKSRSPAPSRPARCA